jgi:hypothetical protein
MLLKYCVALYNNIEVFWKNLTHHQELNEYIE